MPTALVIEDDPSSSTILSILLERGGYRVFSTSEPDEAAGFCHDFVVDVAIADVVLRTPVSGTDVARILRQGCPDIPVLFVSGTPLEGWSNRDFANIEALLPSRVGYLMKPFTAEAFLSAVKQLLAEQYSEACISAAVAAARRQRR